MKNITMIFAFLLTAICVNAQSFDISEAPRAKDDGVHNSFMIELPDVSSKEAADQWAKSLKSFKAKTKKQRKSNIWLTDDAKMPKLSNGSVDVYAQIVESSEPSKRTSVTVWFDMGSAYASSEEDSLKGTYIKELLTDFGMKASKQRAQAIFKMEEKKLSDLEKDLKKLKKANKDYQSAIEKAKDTISKNEKNIEKNKLDQQNKSKEIEVQNATLKLAKEQVDKFN
ncbi:MAG: hypothetical protein AAF990_09765 [Bacteroidota bacterium]